MGHGAASLPMHGQPKPGPVAGGGYIWWRPRWRQQQLCFFAEQGREGPQRVPVKPDDPLLRLDARPGRNMLLYVLPLRHTTSSAACLPWSIAPPPPSLSPSGGPDCVLTDCPSADEYESIVPATVPPSYRGESISYTHKVVVGTQRVSGEVKIVRLPFRVLPITDKMEQVRRHGSVGRYSETGLLRDMAHAHVETGSAGGEVTPGRKPHAEDGEAAVFERPGDGDAVSQGTLSGGESGTTTATENSLAGSAAASVDGDGRSVVGRAGCITERPCTMNE